jgi:hypothetical protein
MEQKSHAKVNDLALLALLASNELEELNLRGNADCFYVARLFEHLSAEIPEPTPEGVKRLAPSTMRVYERAVHEATNKQSNNLASLSKMLAGFLRDLKTASQSTARQKVDSAELLRLLAFLNSLHDQLITQKQRVINKRVASRHRI